MTLFRRIREQFSGGTGEAGPLDHRVQLLRRLAARIPSRSYLEIGCNRNGVFKQIHAERKVGVDPTRCRPFEWPARQHRDGSVADY